MFVLKELLTSPGIKNCNYESKKVRRKTKQVINNKSTHIYTLVATIHM